jgi:hypothetical protein
MAFFATIEDLPYAKAQWSPRHRGRVNPRERRPPVRPPRKPNTIPSKTPSQHFCTDGHTRVLVRTSYGRSAYTCQGPIPYAYRSLINTSDQIRGRRKPIRVSSAVQKDRKPTRRTTRGYLPGKYRYYVNENIEDN